MRQKKWALCLGAFFIAALLSAAPARAESPGQGSGEIPEILGMTTHRIGSASYALATALGEVFKEKTAKKIRVIPIAAEKGRIEMLRKGEAHLSAVPGNILYAQEFGLEDYANREWGVQPLQMAWIGPLYMAPVTTKTQKDINSLSDLKGKRLAMVPNRAGNLIGLSFLAYAGLSFKDIVEVPVPGYTAQFKALISGQVDAVPFANLTSSVLYEVEASPKGLKWIPVPQGSAEGWKRLRSIAPWGFPTKASIGPGLSKENRLEALNVGYTISTYEWTSPELVYLVTKTIGENIEKLQGMVPAWKICNMEEALDIELIPHVYHPGAVRYFKEKGLWTANHQSRNERNLELQQRAKEAWAATLKEAKAKDWSAEELRSRWHERQKTITGYTVVE
ncbi:MAG: TAXI family TRAP transporter solute-binding subunit [Deltaproteobacteria bacterium]|jgi:TRAP transporter TAXI family solute receptor